MYQSTFSGYVVTSPFIHCKLTVLIDRRWVRSWVCGQTCLFVESQPVVKRASVSSFESLIISWFAVHFLLHLKQEVLFSHELGVFPVDSSWCSTTMISIHSSLISWVHNLLCTCFCCTLAYHFRIFEFIGYIPVLRVISWTLLRTPTRWSPVFCRSAPLPAGSLFRVSAGAI